MEENLLEIATKARARAYAPYSKFSVGAALLSASGRVFARCNVENISFGLTMCAERVCVGSALQEGEKAFRALVIITYSKEPVMPCGACRHEFSPDLRIVGWTVRGQRSEVKLATLLPMPQQGIRG